MSDLDEDASEQGPKAEIERLLREALELMKHGHIPGYRKDARRKIADALASLDDVEDKKYIIGKDGQKVHWEHPLELVARGPSGKVIYKPGYEPPAEEPQPGKNIGCIHSHELAYRVCTPICPKWNECVEHLEPPAEEPEEEE